MSERLLRNAVLKAASECGARLFRVNTGNAWAGKVTHMHATCVMINDAYPIRMGLTVGGSDLIGWSRDGKFVAIELKVGRTALTVEQENFLAAVRQAGGLAGVARSVADAVAILGNGPAKDDAHPRRQRDHQTDRSTA